MKRYWKSISLVAVIVLVISSFYIQSSLAASSLPEFVFETVSGDKVEIEQLTLEGHLYQNDGLGNRVELNEEGTKYWSDYSYWERMVGIYDTPKMEQLQQDYRKFMRGKNRAPYSFYEDENLLVYVNLTWDTMYGYQPNNFELDIAVLDKVSKEDTSFQVAVPNIESVYYSHDVEGIFVIDGQLKVITRNYGHDSKTQKEVTSFHVYDIDVAAESIKIENIITAKDDEVSANQHREIRMLNHKWDDFQQPSEWAVFQETVLEEHVIDEWEYTYEPIERELFVYNLKTEEKQQLTLPKDLSEQASADTIDGTTIYFTEDMEGEFKVISYNFVSGEIEAEQTLNVADFNEQGFMYKINDGKVYVVHASTINASQEMPISVANLKTGEVLYEGKVEIEDPTKDDTDYELHIHTIGLGE